MTMSVSIALGEDEGGIVRCTRQYAEDAGCLAEFDPEHTRLHMRHLIDEGVCFVAKHEQEIVGFIACNRIDTGFCRKRDLETAHIYVTPPHRRSNVIFQLLDSVEGYAAAHDLKVLFHQTDYPSTLRGEEANGRRVETLFKRRRYKGPINVVYVVPDFVRAGITYLFEPGMRKKAS